MLKDSLVNGRKRLCASLFFLVVPLMMLWAQEMNEKYSMTTQMFLNGLNEKAEKPKARPRRTYGLKPSEMMMKPEDRSMIASPDTVDGVAYISCFIHLKDENDLSAVRSLGIGIEEVFDGLGFVTARVPVSQLETLAGIDNVTRIKVAQRMRMMTNAAKEKTNVDDLLTLSDDAIAQGITSMYDGTGIVLGIIDIGIDFQHIAFKDKNGNSRIKWAYVYDGTGEAVYTSMTSNSPTTDDEAEDHGTHTASTAGGSSVIVNGSTVTVTDDHANATYGGMAPGVDLYLAGVKGLSDTYLSNALKKMVQYADDQGKPIVVSNSWGSEWGPHDGTGEWADLVSQYFGDSHPNHIILFASSNDAGHSKDGEGGGYFVKKSSASSTSPLGTVLRSASYSNADGGYLYDGLISVAWASEPLNGNIYVLNSSTGEIQRSWTVTSSTSSFSGLSDYYDGNLTVYKGSENGKYYLQLQASELETKGRTATTKNDDNYYNSNYTLAVEVYPASGSADVNMWSGGYSYFTNHLSTTSHTWMAGTDDMCVSNEATIPDAISVGAYVSKADWTDYSGAQHSNANIYTLGDIAYFSSYATPAQSPTGLAYPWITAPGARLAAGVNHYHTTSVDDYSYYGNYSEDLVVNNSNSPYAMMEGTSMATPVAAGIVALWLQAAQSVNKSLTVNDVKDIMKKTAINDDFTTTGTNASHFGKGKIDALAGIRRILTETGPRLFTITPVCGEGGRLQLSAETAELNGSVTVTIIPDEDMEFETLTINGRDVTGEVVNLQYTIANVREDVEVNATFRSIYDFITVSAAGEGTYCSDRDLDFSGVEGLKAYIASGFIKKTGTVLLTRVTDVPALTGLMVKAAPGTYRIPSSSSTAYYVNMLKGNVEAVSVDPTEGVYTNYYLSDGSDGLGFYQIKATRTMSAHRAILQIPTSVVNSARRLNVAFEDETTDIRGIRQLDSRQSDDCYDLQGRRINSQMPAWNSRLKKGFYIKNGKKVILVH